MECHSTVSLSFNSQLASWITASWLAYAGPFMTPFLPCNMCPSSMHIVRVAHSLCQGPGHQFSTSTTETSCPEELQLRPEEAGQALSGQAGHPAGPLLAWRDVQTFLQCFCCIITTSVAVCPVCDNMARNGSTLHMLIKREASIAYANETCLLNPVCGV